MTQNKSRAPRAGEVERKERRRAANRRSAQKSRYRETILMDELQRTVNDLTQKNELLRQENMKFRRDVEILQGFSVSTSGCNKNQADSLQQTGNMSAYEAPGFLKLRAQTDYPSKAISNIFNLVLRTPSPIDSMNLHPEKVFPFDGGVQQQGATFPEDRLFHAATLSAGFIAESV